MPRKKATKDTHDPSHDPSPSPETLTWYVPRFSRWMLTKNMSARTVDGRERSLGHFVTWADARSITRPHQVTLPILERYAGHLFARRKSDGTPLKARTQHAHLSNLRAFFRWLTRQKIITTNPAAELELPRTGTRLPSAVLTATEADQVIAQPDVTELLGLRNRAILETLYSTGIRRREVCDLSVFDVDFERGTVMVREGKGRGGKDRVVAIGDRALTWIARYVDEVRPELVVPPDDRTLFVSARGTALTAGYLTQLMSTYVAKAGVGKRGACHIFRHTAATLMHDHGADIRDIQAQLGHAKLSTTAIYTRVSIKRLKEVHGRTHPAEQEVGHE